ncbi:DNA binding domain, excisionase family [Lysinibacillus capsici]|uniref:DNA binding domain, excisionase family n=1 Tax=Lysinibacillus capsici TaxID=2115968 RepID=A0A2X1BG44_9BACI|nr:helix-turn-helix domain-containing protein [Lysinibacillus capsici]SPU40711.1 DNA binding domain, excisionase family [Lysinibacillus capsici]
MGDIKNQEVKFYTRQQVAEMLDISERTVYTYVRDNKIRVAPNPYKIRKEAVYYCEEVDALVKAKKTIDPASTIAHVAKELGVSRQHIEYLITANSLNTNRIQRKNTVRITLPKETIEKLEELVQESQDKSPKYRKSTYFNEMNNIALYQRFVQEDGTYFRVDLVNNKWGYRDDEGHFIDLESAETTLKLKPVYNINQEPIKESNYVELTLTKDKPEVWLIFDYFLSTRGIENISIRNSAQSIQLYVVQGIISLTKNPLPTELSPFSIAKYITAGDIVIEQDELFIIGSSKRLYTYIKLDNYNSLIKEANIKDVSIGEMLDEILEAFFNQEGKLK